MKVKMNAEKWRALGALAYIMVTLGSIPLATVWPAVRYVTITLALLAAIYGIGFTVYAIITTPDDYP